MKVILYAVTIWPAAGQIVENTKWPAVRNRNNNPNVNPNPNPNPILTLKNKSKKKIKDKIQKK